MAIVYDGLEKTLAGLPGVTLEVESVADRIAIGARANAAKHERDGAFERSIKVVKAAHGKDRLVIATDPLAVPKELGHVIKNEPDGEVLGYVKGQYSLRNAALELPPE